MEELVLSFYHRDPRNGTAVVRLHGECRYLLAAWLSPPNGSLFMVSSTMIYCAELFL